MDSWPSLQSSVMSALKEEEKHLPQPKPPAKPVENPITLTIQGQRTVQEIVDKAIELFRKLQNARLSTDTTSRQSQAQTKDIRDQLNTLKGLLAKLRNVYNDTKRAVTIPAGENVENLIPLECSPRNEMDTSDGGGPVEQERAELQKKLKEKNDQLKEVIDKLRIAVWDINTMIMLKPS
ncbi:mediator of RNA polymerase II transcription subunit 30 [Nematostella vectensis]|uniref:mediator of RNA polymerase II transcription subunit 30 n=1 Tax=Nematostella vectensis TaxID=45351 RepID=UPI0020773301|nr:mediator of RNA polymerase II transcription subunit 30 [Nematostella vectensis]